MNYEDFLFKVPVESSDYRENSDFVIQQIESIIKEAIDSQRNKIFINTNQKKRIIKAFFLFEIDFRINFHKIKLFNNYKNSNSKV